MANTGVIVAGGALAILGIYLLTKKGRAEPEPSCWIAVVGPIYNAIYQGPTTTLGESLAPGQDPDTVGFAWVNIFGADEQWHDVGTDATWDDKVFLGSAIRFQVLNPIEICNYNKS